MTEITDCLEVDLIYSPIINFAMQQNHVPTIRKLTIKNIGEIDLSKINIQILPTGVYFLKFENGSALKFIKE